VYDNFDYREGVKHQLMSNYAEMRYVTTGKVFRGADIPLGGLLWLQTYDGLKESSVGQIAGLPSDYSHRQ
jgi:hypothetical protein